jgi:hypothetical protein
VAVHAQRLFERGLELIAHLILRGIDRIAIRKEVQTLLRQRNDSLKVSRACKGR